MNYKKIYVVSSYYDYDCTKYDKFYYFMNLDDAKKKSFEIANNLLRNKIEKLENLIIKKNKKYYNEQLNFFNKMKINPTESGNYDLVNLNYEVVITEDIIQTE